MVTIRDVALDENAAATAAAAAAAATAGNLVTAIMSHNSCHHT